MLAGELTVPDGSSGTVELSGIVEAVSGRRLVVSDERCGRVAVFLSTTADVTGLLEPGVRLRVEGTVIEDLVRTARVEVMASVVTTVEARAPDWIASR